MKNNFLKTLTLITGLVGVPSLTQAAPDPNFHIYLMFGQSNMEGQGQISASDRIVPDGLLAMQADQNCSGPNGEAFMEWRPAVPPLIRCFNTAHNFNNGGLGPGDGFGRAMLSGSGSGVKIGLVGAAYQGQKIEFFLKNCGGNCSPSGANGSYPFSQGGYKWLIEMAKKAQEDGVIKGIIFHQGESNTGDSSWPGKVNQVVSDLRTDLGIGNVPFIAGEMVPNACCVSHNTQVHRIPEAVTNGHYVSAAGLSKRSDDNYHFDAAGARGLGQRYAEKMLTLVDTTGGPVDCGSFEGNPICCDISADPDGDGWGTQNESESCVVTRETRGYVPPNPVDVVAAINVGSTQVAAFEDIYYKADVDFDGGTTNSTSDPVSGANGSTVMQTERYGDYSYEIKMPNGNYSVELFMVEMYQTATGNRVFSVSVEDKVVVDSIDLFAQVGHDTLYRPAKITTSVGDGSLSIDVTKSVDNGTLSAILVRKVGATSSAASSSSQSASSLSSAAVTSSSSSSSSGSTGGGSVDWLLLVMLSLLAAASGRLVRRS